jgi:transcription termination/antitermination protein NusG
MKEDLEQSAATEAEETGAVEAPAETAAAVETSPEASVETPEVEPEAKSPKAGAAQTKKKAKAETAEQNQEPAEEATVAPEGESAAAAEPPPVKNENFRWYILHAYSGFERKVRESIESRVQAFGLRERVGRVMIPTEPVTEIVNGKKRTIERVFLPGYVLVEMELDNELWHVLKDTPKVTGFLGTGDKPVALSEEEVSSILFRSETSKDKPRMKIKFEKGEQVRITDGPFANFNGVVDEVNEDRETLKVMVTIFGRSTPVELEFGKVEKIE